MATDFAKELAELDALDRERAASSASSGPTLPPPASGADAPVAAPEPEPLTQWERDNRMANEIGRSIWKNGNARYDPGTMNTQAHYMSDYVYDPDEVEPVDKTHFRRRDKFTNYVEAAARMKSIHGSKKKMMP